MSDSEVIIEFIRQGRFVKVTAVDPVTGIEASIVGDPNTSPTTLQQLAVKKLRYVINKQQEKP